MRGIFTKILALIALLIGVVSSLASAEAQNKIAGAPYQIQWPPGWEVTEKSNGESSPDKRVFRAVRMHDGKPEGVLFITCTKHGVEDQMAVLSQEQIETVLSKQFETFIGEVRTAIKSIKIPPSQKVKVGRYPARRTEFMLPGPEGEMKQIVVGAIAPRYLYRFHLVAPGKVADQVASEFEGMLREITLQ